MCMSVGPTACTRTRPMAASRGASCRPPRAHSTATLASTLVGLTENAAKTGVSTTWSYSLGLGANIGFVGGPKVNAAGTRVYIAARNANVYAFNATLSGSIAPLWTAAAGGAVTVSTGLSTAEDRHYVGTSTGILR